MAPWLTYFQAGPWSKWVFVKYFCLFPDLFRKDDQPLFPYKHDQGIHKTAGFLSIFAPFYWKTQDCYTSVAFCVLHLTETSIRIDLPNIFAYTVRPLAVDKQFISFPIAWCFSGLVQICFEIFASDYDTSHFHISFLAIRNTVLKNRCESAKRRWQRGIYKTQKQNYHYRTLSLCWDKHQLKDAVKSAT